MTSSLSEPSLTWIERVQHMRRGLDAGEVNAETYFEMEQAFLDYRAALPNQEERESLRPWVTFLDERNPYLRPWADVL